jgi:hypothetical protein
MMISKVKYKCCDDIFISDKGGFSKAYFHIYTDITYWEMFSFRFEKLKEVKEKWNFSGGIATLHLIPIRTAAKRSLCVWIM